MISTSRGRASVHPWRHDSQHGPCGWSYYCLITFLYLLLCLSGCHSELLGSTSNITLTADNACLLDTVRDGTFRIYRMDFHDCLGEDVDGWLNIELVVTNRTARKSLSYQPIFWLMVDPRGLLPTLNVTSNGTDGTVITVIGDGPFNSNSTSVSLRLSQYDKKFPWFANVSAVYEDVSFFLRAWCTVSRGCQHSCSADAERCVGVGTCKCTISEGNATCQADVITLETISSWDVDGVQVISSQRGFLSYGDWRYFSFEVEEPNARVLVELSGEDGDLALFLKPRSANGNLPSESDFEGFADKLSFRNRLSYQYIYHPGGGSFNVGILNNGACIQKSSTYNLTVKAAAPYSTLKLCPLNCSHPHGRCVKDGVCECLAGYAGEICDGSLQSAELSQMLSGNLAPGQTAYVKLNLEDISSRNPLSIRFSHIGGHPVLLGQFEGYPTLTNNTIKFFEAPTLGNVVNTYNMSPINRSENRSFLFAVLNRDDIVRGSSKYELMISEFEDGMREDSSRNVKPTLIILVGFMSSLFACLGMGLVKFLLHRWQGDRDYVPEEGENVQDATTARGGLDREIVESFPTIIFQENMNLQESECAICLGDFCANDLLRVIPLCTHTFHATCIDQWLQDNANCPVCRIALHRNALSILISSPPREAGDQ